MAMKTEWLILADGAEVSGGKLYLLGGGWDTLTVNQVFPLTRQIAIAASYTVPWNDTNMRHDVEIEICTQDGETLAKVNGQLEAGRPAGMPVGTDQRAQIAANMPIEFKLPGVYSIISRVGGEVDARTTFRVVGGQQMMMPLAGMPRP